MENKGFMRCERGDCRKSKLLTSHAWALLVDSLCIPDQINIDMSTMIGESDLVYGRSTQRWSNSPCISCKTVYTRQVKLLFNTLHKLGMKI